MPGPKVDVMAIIEGMVCEKRGGEAYMVEKDIGDMGW